MFRVWVGLVLAGLAGCAELVTSTPREIAAARHVSAEAPYVALLTVVDRESGQGAHSALLVNGSQVALYDPAGTFMFPGVVENADVLYGMTPRALEVYEFFHARETTSVLEQKVQVSREVADTVIARMQAQGPSPKFLCSVNTSEILADIPRFSAVPTTYFPTKLMSAFDEIPGVQRREVFDNDAGKNIRWATQAEQAAAR